MAHLSLWNWSWMLLRAVAQSGEIVERMRDELLAARILSLGCGGEELYEILRLGRGLRPGLRRSGQEKLLELFLATLQGRLIGLKLMQALTPNVCRFLSGHAAVLVEVDRVVRHRLIPMSSGCRLESGRFKASAPPVSLV